MVITTGSTTGNYHRTYPAVFWDVPQESTTRSLPQEYHRSVPHKYHRAIPDTSCGTYHRKYHRKLPQVCGILGHTTGQYHTLVTTGIPQVSTTGIPQVSTTGIPQEYHRSVPQDYHRNYHMSNTTGLPQASWYHRNTTQHYHKNTTHYHRNTTHQYTTWIPYSTTMHSATCCYMQFS